MRPYKSYSGDPYWITCKYPATCAKCGAAIAKGQRAYRYKSGKLYGEACGCGLACDADFVSAAADEAFYNFGS